MKNIRLLKKFVTEIFTMKICLLGDKIVTQIRFNVAHLLGKFPHENSLNRKN